MRPRIAAQATAKDSYGLRPAELEEQLDRTFRDYVPRNLRYWVSVLADAFMDGKPNLVGAVPA